MLPVTFERPQSPKVSKVEALAPVVLEGESVWECEAEGGVLVEKESVKMGFVTGGWRGPAGAGTTGEVRAERGWRKPEVTAAPATEEARPASFG